MIRTNCKMGILFQHNISKHCAYVTQSFTTQVQGATVDVAFDNARPFSEIPGPSTFAMIRGFLPGGKYHNKDPVDMHIALKNEYGSILKFPGSFGRNDIVFTYDPNDFETVFRTEGLWPHRRPIYAFDYFRRNVRPDVYKNIGGLVNDQGEPWAHLRSAANPAMLQPKIVRAYIPTIDDVAIDFVAKMKTIGDENQEMPANFGTELNKWALESIAVIALEHRLGVITNENDPESQKIIKSVKDMFHLGFKAEVLPPIWKYVKTPMFKQLMEAFNTITDVSKKYVDNAIERISKGNTKNLEDGSESVLEKLLKINPDYAFIMAMDMLLAGIDTTSTVVADLLYHLAKNPAKQEKLREEIMKILPTVDSKLTTTSLNSIPYMRACIKETMRLTPPIPGNMRGTGKNLVLQGYKIPKDSDVAMVGVVLQLDDAHFTRSKEFIPERWLNGDEELKECPNNGRSDNPFAFLPFGFGPRTCIGKRFAEMEASVVIFRILREFKVEWHYGPLKFVQAFIVTPSNDLKFKMIPLK